MPRNATRLAALATALLLAWFLVVEHRSALSAPPMEGLTSAPAEAGSDLQPLLEARATARQAQPTGSDEPRIAIAALKPAPGPATLRGRVLLEDERGILRGASECTIELWMDCLDEGLEIYCSDGTWTVELDPEALQPKFLDEDGTSLNADLGTLEVWSILVGDQPALATQSSFNVHRGQETIITCRLPQPTLLRVIDGATGVELNAVDVASAYSDLIPVTQEDMHDELVVRSEPSPLSFSPNFEDMAEMLLENSLPWWIGSQGYGWERVIIDHRRGGERSVELFAAGSLELTLLGDWPQTTSIELSPLFGPLEYEDIIKLIPASGRPLSVPRLAPGTWRVSASSGVHWRHRATLASAEVLITAGATSELELEIPALAPLGDPVPMGGILEVPPTWMETGTLTMSLEILDDLPHDYEVIYHSDQASVSENTEVRDLPRVDGEANQYQWHGGLRPPGRYAAQIALRGAGCLWRQEFELGYQGDERLLLVMPAPARIRVVPVDAETTRPILGGHASQREVGVGFSFRGSGGQMMFTPLHGEVDATSGTFVSTLPVGPVRLSVDADGYMWETVHLEIQPGDNDVTVLMHPLLEVQVSLTCDGGPVTVPDNWFWNTEATDLTGEELDMGCENSPDRPEWVRFLLPNVGTCRLVFPEVNGYERPSPVELRLDPLQPIELILNLRRK
ncbi:MAG: hypothetical protein ABGY29_17660 [bacterium]